MNNLLKKIPALPQRFNGRNQRERLIILVATIVLLYTAWDYLLYQPLTTQLQQTESAFATQKDDRLKTQSIVSKLHVSQSADTIKKLKQEIHQLEKQVTSASKSIELFSTSFIASNEMVDVLKNLLTKETGLTLLKLENIPIQANSLTAKQTPAGQQAEQQSGHSSSDDPEALKTYKHTFVMELSGSYLNALNYLQAIENLPWRIAFDSVTYSNQPSTPGLIRIQLHTISLSEGWVRV